MMILTALTLGVGLGGCQVAGGGHIPSHFDADEKATFGFEAACVPDFTDAGDAGATTSGVGDDGGFVASGQFQYKDHAPDGYGTIVQLHGTVDTAIALPTDAGDAGDFGGTTSGDTGDTGGLELCGLRTDGGLAVIDDGGDEGAWIGFFAGTYRPQPPKIRGVPRAGGYFQVYWEDTGEPPGLSDADHLAIQLFGGVFDGYYNEGELGGGNIDFEFLVPEATAN
ncbi:MAG: hypothetical protein ABFS41_05635 [Myxococcota bacterium]